MTQPPQPTQHESKTLEHCILTRHSIRSFTTQPVPLDILHSCLQLAQHAPSNSNIQNWRLTLATGPARDRIVSALNAEASTHGPNIPPLPQKFTSYRSELGHLLYGPRGYDIPRSDKAAWHAAQLRNFSFFDAPVVGIVSQDKCLGLVDALSVGLFLQTFVLALTERGLGSCLQVSVTGFPEVMRREFGVGEEQELLCGIAIGWPNGEETINDLGVPREEVETCVRILSA